MEQTLDDLALAKPNGLPYLQFYLEHQSETLVQGTGKPD